MAIQRSERFEGEEKEAKRESQVHEWLEGARKEVARAGEVQAQIENRLSSVLRQCPTKKEEPVARGPYPVVEEVVSLANAIREIVWDMARMSDQYRDMLGRLEL